MSQSVQDHRASSPDTISVAVMTISDTRTFESDSSGQIIRELLAGAGHSVADYRIVPDDATQIDALLRQWSDVETIDAIITNGGTGIATRDTTYAAIQQTLTTTLTGFGELFRMLSYQEIGAAAMLSRAAAGAIGQCAVFSLPGSSNAVRLGMEKLIVPELAHVVYELRK